jgi:hypothetical protein
MEDRSRDSSCRKRAGVTVLRRSNGVVVEVKQSEIEERTMSKISAMPVGLASNLSPEQHADLLVHPRSLE